MAVREWQLRHDGRFPDRLEDLVPDELPSPADRPVHRPAVRLHDLRPGARPHRPADWPQLSWPADTRLIYSAGPDGRDDGGLFHSSGIETPGDMVFPIRPLPVE